MDEKKIKLALKEIDRDNLRENKCMGVEEALDDIFEFIVKEELTNIKMIATVDDDKSSVTIVFEPAIVCIKCYSLSLGNDCCHWCRGDE